MLDDRIRAELEQARAALVELWPPLWYQLYEALKREGFSEQQSMELVKAYILACSPGGVRGT